MTTPAIQNPFELASFARNPFAPRPTVAAVAADAPEGSYEYRMLESAPAVASEECESSAAAVEIRVSWGRSLLSVAHLSPARAYW
ncbi:MAG: FHA domain-containing protein, partial [Myxococcales bacterium]|nr:FHA domain-containing protein [Myxococcales bacterium]